MARRMVGPGQSELLGQADLVVEAITGGEIAFVDGMLDLLGDLEVQRNRAGAIQVDKELGHRSLPGVEMIVAHVSPT